MRSGREVSDLRREIVEVEENDVWLAADMASHPSYYKTNISIYDMYIDILHRVGQYHEAEEESQTHQRELDKHQYVLRRALVEYYQIVKDKENAAMGNMIVSMSSLSEMESHVEDELREAFAKLVEFMSKTMYIKHDEFVTAVHEAARVNDYSLILNQLDVKIHDKFKQNPVVGRREIAKIACDLTGIPASWFFIEDWDERFIELRQRLLERVYKTTRTGTAIGSVVEVLYNQTDWDRWTGKPMGVFLFEGSNWVSKADLARAVAGELYDNEDHVVRIDMAKYAEPDSVSSLVDTITRTMKNRPCSVLVLDKIEMAHSCVVDALRTLLNGHVNGIGFQKTLIFITTESSLIELTTMVDEVIMACWPSDLKDCCRILLREWALNRTNIEGNRPVIICPSKSALIEMETHAGNGTVATVEGLERWMNEKVFPMLSKMVSEYDGAAQNILIYIGKEEETGELSFSFE